MSDSTRKRRAAWVAAGLCSMCGRREPVDGGRACAECRKRYRGYRAKYREKGLCKCGRLPASDGETCVFCREGVKKANRRIRHQVIMAYGGYKCTCCGETTPEFLQIDHIDNDGAEHRRHIGKGYSVIWWIIRNNFPPGFQVLCANCNHAKAIYGYCPHHREKTVNDHPTQHTNPPPIEQVGVCS